MSITLPSSVGSHTAALLEPYADDPKNVGLPQYDSAKLGDMAKERVLDGFQLGFHAIGDKGAQLALDAFAEAEKAAKEKKVKAANGADDYRLRIEHAQVVTPLEIVKFRDLKVIASMQPCHVLTDMRDYEQEMALLAAQSGLTLEEWTSVMIVDYVRDELGRQQ